MFGKLFADTTAPVILSLTISFLGWLVTGTIGLLADTTILQYSHRLVSNDTTRITITNASIKQAMSDAVLTFTCRTQPCFKPIDGSNYAKTESVVPYFIPQNAICRQAPDSIIAVITLPPKAEFRFEFKETALGESIMMFSGFTKEMKCPDTSSILSVGNLWIIKGCSLITLATEYYFYILPNLIIMTIAFLIIVLFKPTPKEKAYDT